MGSICFSSASILRCSPYTSSDNFLIVPTALEVIFSTSLIFINWNAGRRHLLLTFEGWTYLAISIVELLSHMLPAARRSVSVFRAFDLAIGITSFLPLLLYTLFLYIFTRSELLTALPLRFRKVPNLALGIFIPGIVLLNATASFVGVTIREVRFGQGAPLTLSIGFASKKDETLWFFFTSLTLALFTVFQATIFCFAFYRLIQALISQRRIETNATDAAHLFKGIGWINAAIKLGAIETVVGFAGGGFSIALTRRIIRFLARAFLCIGLAKGVDEVEDFRAVRNEISAVRNNKRGSRLRQFISNPRASTFRPLSATATSFYASRAGAGLPGMGQFEKMNDEKGGQRVTVHYSEGAPTLHMRFSSLDLPNPAMIVDSVKARPISPEWLAAAKPVSIRNSTVSYSPSFADSAQIITAPQRTLSQKSAKAKMVHTSSSGHGHVSASSQQTTKSETLLVVRELAAQFPGTPMSSRHHGRRLSAGDDGDNISIPPSAASSEGFPPRLTTEEKGKQPIRSPFLEVDSPVQRTSPAPSPEPRRPLPSAPNAFKNTALRLTPQPPPISAKTTSSNASGYSEISDDPFIDEKKDQLADLLVSQPNRNTFGTNYAYGVEPVSASSFTDTPITTLSGYTQTIQTSTMTADTEDPFLDLGMVMDASKRDSDIATRTAQWIGRNKPMDELPSMDMIEGRSTKARTPRSVAGAPMTPKTASTMDSRAKSIQELNIPWLKNPNMEDEERKLAMGLAMGMPNQLSRIKSVGKAPRRLTPRVTQSGIVRSSTHLEPIIIPPRQPGMTEIDQGSLSSAYSGRGVLRDSEVLGIEDGTIVREMKNQRR
ncbi:hypothetical protein BDQ12DRAFT_739753 [Crucibulum laeve]|uniref:Uncharacterized protein n=1 Tax=Crucibulum laeve TaxID=68775 RepID=A0A5C3LGF4_9AGAR|nr:hypothetical protein BDQ12DRAFT_739753 [Crucibulum laeve]